MNMARVAVTDGMSDEAVKILENVGHEVILRHYEPDEIANGALAEFDAVVIRSCLLYTSPSLAIVSLPILHYEASYLLLLYAS